MIIAIAFLILVLVGPVAAHNGSVAVAYPVDGIVVDGDLSDWPADMERYEVSSGGDQITPEDWRGEFRVGYNERENAIYVALEVEDDSVVRLPEEGMSHFAAQDGSEIYFELTHSEENIRSAQYVRRGEEIGVWGEGPAEDMEVAVDWGEGGYRYEWRFDVGKRNDAVRVGSGMVLGFDLGFWDRDRDGSVMWVTWQGRGGAKYVRSDALGDLLLFGERSAMGGISGAVQWRGTDKVQSRASVQIRSASRADFRLNAEADAAGAFSLALPPGEYLLSAGRFRLRGEEVAVEVVSGGLADGVVVVQEPPTGVVVAAGEGRRVKAGAGTRVGAWQVYGVADGLPSNAVNKVFQDSWGDLWFGTEAGACRFDGEYFTTFTSEHGLASDWVWTIAEDAQGNLWFGTGSPYIGGNGLSRYDGQRFTTFAAEDGLGDGQVFAIYPDGEGNLWIGLYRGGLSRYDGHHFANYTTRDGLSTNFIARDGIAEDNKGNLWIGTTYNNQSGPPGITRFDGASFSVLSDRVFSGVADLYAQGGANSNRIMSVIADREGALWIGTEMGLVRYDGADFEMVVQRTETLEASYIGALFQDGEGNLWSSFWDGVARFDREDLQAGIRDSTGIPFARFSTAGGLVSFGVSSITADREGSVWVGTGYFGRGGGASRYDGATFAALAEERDWAKGAIYPLLETRAGEWWMGREGEEEWDEGRLSFYDGATVRDFTVADGLAQRAGGVQSLFADSRGHIWFSYGFWTGLILSDPGVGRYDGERFEFFTTNDGLASNRVMPIFEDRHGNMWFGTEGGVSRYDGENFTTLWTSDGLVQSKVWSIAEDSEGAMWFGTEGGVSRYDGERFVNYTVEDGLVDNAVYAIFKDDEGVLWFGTGGGVSRYDGEDFVNYTTEDGLGGSIVRSIAADREGRMLFGSMGGGVTIFDGLVFQTLLKRDGLASDQVLQLLPRPNGDLWINTAEGVIRYRPQQTPPPVRIVNVVAEREYGPVDEIELASTRSFVAFEFRGRSFKTDPDRMAYVYRLTGHDTEWRWTHARRVTYGELPTGDYTFEVKAVDRDLTYSQEAATVRVSVHPPYGQIGLLAGLALALVGLVVASGSAISRRRERDRVQAQLVDELEAELQTAHELQMGLMPTEGPQMAGYDIVGRCIPATHVGGDFFQYFPQDGRLTIALADVTGHAMEAAVPVMMFSGILETEIHYGHGIETLIANMNRTLSHKLGDRTFICVAMASLDIATRKLDVVNGGCPYPFHYRAASGEIVELELDAYPLGIRLDSEYNALEVQLEAGDCVVFCSDGIIEAANAAEDIFGFERTAETIREGCAQGLGAGAMIDRLVGAVQAFAGGVPQADDITCVVLRVA